MKLKFLTLFVLVSVLVSLFSFQPAYAAGTITVNTPTDDNAANALCSLREAIVAANTDASYQGCTAGSGVDTILFAGDYTITLASQLPSVASILSIDGNGPDKTIIQANANTGVASYRVMWVSNTGTLYLQDLAVKNGNCTGACAGGGGIYNAGQLSISNSLLMGNFTSTNGGAVFNSLNSGFSLTNSQVSSNSAANGGGIYAASGSILTIDKSTISSNFVTADGGGFYLDSDTTLYLNYSTISGHDIPGNGAGIYYAGGNGSLGIYTTTVSGNWASTGNGGGVYNLGNLNVFNSTFYGNMALYSGGGIYHTAPNTREMNVYNSTFSDNESDLGGGSAIFNASGSVINIFTQNILANSYGAPDCQSNGTIKNGYDNLIQTNGSGATQCTSASTISADPKLGPLMDHGGFNKTMALLAGSPAIDVATCILANDQRSVNRPQSTDCDLGAYEKNLSFTDVPFDHWAWQHIESISYAGITGGCGGGNYCPSVTVTRDQMAVFLLRGIHGSAYTPPAATGAVFADVPADYWAAAWIEQLAAEGITGGCGNGNYCPSTPVTRDQMAIFLLRAEHGSAYTPPTATGAVFGDIPANFWAGAWVEQLAAEGITGGCGGGNYCPSTPVTRDQMAVFLQRTFNLVLP